MEGESQWSSLRPESISLTEPGQGRIDGQLAAVRFMGATNYVTVAVEGGKISAQLDANVPLPQLDSRVAVTWTSESMHAMESES